MNSTIQTTVAAAACLTLTVLGAVAAGSPATDDSDGVGPSDVIVRVMQDAMTSGLAKRVATDEATDAEKQELLDLFTELEPTVPPVGDKAEWDGRILKLIAAAQDALEEADGYPQRLRKAVNCGACHKAHRDW